MRTGVTIRNLRRARYLWVCLRQGLELPSWPETELERVWLLLGALEHPALGLVELVEASRQQG
jgi:hypothetical protein